MIALPADAIVWDNHACMPLRPGDTRFLPGLERLRAAGFHVVSLNIGYDAQGPLEHLRMLATLRTWIAAHTAHYAVAGTLAEIDAARSAGKLAVVFDLEGAGALADAPELARLYADLGVRWAAPVYNRANALGAGCLDEIDEGLTAAGRAVIAALHEAGIAVCCSHAGARTALDIIAAAPGPAVFSHSNCAALHAHPRNIGDAAIRACTQRGGVIGINGIGDFLAAPGADLIEAMACHIDHVVQIAGPAHVGLALDYAYDPDELAALIAASADSFPAGLSAAVPMLGPEVLAPLVGKLSARGYDEAALALVLGGSWRRIAAEVWLGGAGS